MRVEVFRCDMCDTEKKQGNHWFVVDLTSNSYTVKIWSEDSAQLYGHICGESCLSKSIGQWAGRLVAA